MFHRNNPGEKAIPYFIHVLHELLSLCALEYDGVEYHTKNPDIVTKHNFTQEYLDYDISRQIELESYGYRFLRLNKFNLRPEQKGETKGDVLDRLLRKAFVVE